MKKYAFSFIPILFLLQANAQTFYAVTGVHSNLNEDSAFFINSNRTYQLSVANCDSIKLSTCLPTNANSGNQDYFYLDIAIDTAKNLYWVSAEGRLYTRKFNDSTSCQFLGLFDSDYVDEEMNSLVTDISGNVYAVGLNELTGSNLYKYDPIKKAFFNLGSLPINYYSSGDLFFYEGKLFLSAYADGIDGRFLLEIVITNPSQSCYYMDLGNLNPYAAFSIQNGTCSEAYIISADDTTSTLYKLDLYAKTVSASLCTYPFLINGAASVYYYAPSIIDSNACTNVDSCISLPITLLNFTSTILNKTVKLQWQTTTEINSDYFSIERCSDGINFSDIGKVNAAGNSNGLRQYAFVDKAPLSTNYYRLKEVDLDGNYKYSNILLVKMPQVQPLIIMGNPVQNDLQIQINISSSQPNNLSIYDFMGRRLKTFNVQSGVQNIDVSSLTAGTYILQMITADGQLYDKVFVKGK